MDSSIIVHIDLHPYRLMILPRVGEWVLIEGTRLIVKEVQHSLRSSVVQTADSSFETTVHRIDIKVGRQSDTAASKKR